MGNYVANFRANFFILLNRHPADLNFALPRPPLPGGKARSPSLHETHFDGSDFDLPRTVLHHPDPYTTAAGTAAQPTAGGASSGVQYQPLPYYQQVRNRCMRVLFQEE